MPRRVVRRRGRKARKPFRKYRKGGRRAGAIATAGSGQMARIVETVEFNDNVPNQTYQNTFTLAQFPRAGVLSGNFQFYKAAKVTWSYEPLFNTFQENQIGGAGQSVSKPYLYMLMNRVQNLNNGLTLQNIQACGAKPQSLISKKSITYRPNWCSPGLTAVTPGNDPVSPIQSMASQGLKCQYGWLGSAGRMAILNGPNGQYVPLATVSANQSEQMSPINDGLTGKSQNALIYNNNAVYNGHTTYVEQTNAVLAQPVARLTCTVEWHFKGAVFNNTITPYPPPSSTTA